jgi:hypothetical protein
VRIILVYSQSVYNEVILPIPANIDNAIMLWYKYANYIGLKVRYEMNFNINQPLYIRPLTSGNISALMTDDVIINNDTFGARFISDVNRFTPLAARYSMNDDMIWRTHMPERLILIGCTRASGLSKLENLPDDVQRLADGLTILTPIVNDQLVTETVESFLDEELM